MKNKLSRMMFFVLALLMVMVMSLVPQMAITVSAENASVDPYAALQGKTISILGDSISTFKNWSDGDACTTANSTLGAANWHYNGERKNVVSADDTWWKQTADALGMEILVNNSWAGSFISTTGTEGAGYVPAAYIDRCVQLHADVGANAGKTPDVIAFYMGTNDFHRYGEEGLTTLPMGTAEATLAKTELTEPETVMDAYAICLQKMTAKYPLAQVYCFTLLPAKSGNTDPAEFNADIKALAAAYSVNVVDLYNCGITADNFSTMMGDSLHPNDKGMDAITAAFNSALIQNNCETVKVTYNLAGVNTSLLPAAVISGNTLSATLGISADQTLYVTNANGEAVDYTYANGVLTVENVTSDLTVSRYNHGTHEGWTEWNQDNRDTITTQINSGASGNFVITGTTRISNKLSITTAGQEVVICLNGQSITSGVTRAFEVTNGAKLTFCDCTASGSGSTYTAGTIKYDISSSNTTRAAGAIVYVTGTDCTFTMYDGIFDGAGKDNTAAGSVGGLVHMDGASNTKFYGGKLQNFTSKCGGAVYAKTGSLLIDGNVQFTNVHSPERGGAICAYSATVDISGGSFDNCTITADSGAGGAAIFANGTQMTINGDTTITNCGFASTCTKGYGAAVFVNGGGKATIGGNTKISACKATTNGGAIYGYVTEVVLKDDAVIDNCDATGVGGAVYAHTNTVTVQDEVTITNCDAANGGAIYMASSNTVNITGGTFTNNTSSSHGGFAYIASGDMEVTGGVFKNNKTTGSGAYGGVFRVNSGTLDIDGQAGIAFTGNYAVTGGGVLSVYGGATTVKNSTFTGNSAGWGGGVVFTQNTGTLLLENVTMTGNYAATSSGAVCIQDSGGIDAPTTTLQGKVVIKDNYLNVTVGSSTYKYPSNLTVCSLNRAIKLNGLTADSQIGVNANNNIVNVGADHVVVSSGAMESDLQYFFSDEGHDLTYADSKISVDARGHDGATYHTADGELTDWITTNANLVTAPSESGVYYLQADLHLGTVQQLNNLQNITICLNGYTIYAPTGNTRSFRMNNGVNLTVCDCSATGDTANGTYDAGKLIPGAYSGGVVGMFPICNTEEADTIFTLRDGIIDGTDVVNSGDGGAIVIGYNHDGDLCNSVFNMQGGEIRNCTAVNGGAIYIRENGILKITGGKITNNTATGIGGAAYVEGGTVEVSGSPVITDNIAGETEQNLYLLQNNDVINLSALTDGASIGVTAQRTIAEGEKSKIAAVADASYKAGMLHSDVKQRTVKTDTDGAAELYLMELAVAAEIDGVKYYDPAEAIVAAGATHVVRMNQDYTKDLVLDGNLQLDLNGYDITGDISGEGTLYLIDSKTNDYTVKDEDSYGTITSITGVDVSDWHKVGGKYYLVLDLEDGISAHRVYSSVTAKALRPNSTGIGFQARFATDEVAREKITGFGMNLVVKDGETVKGTVPLDVMALSDRKLDSTGTPLVFAIKDIIKNADAVIEADSANEVALIAENNTRANYTIVGTPFIKLSESESYNGTDSTVTFKGMVTTADSSFTSYNETQKEAVNKMYTTFSKTMSGWELEKIGK